MKGTNVILIVLWVILAFIVIDVGFMLLTAASTIGNIAGFVLLVAAIFFSVKTKCLTNITLKKDEENS